MRFLRILFKPFIEFHHAMYGMLERCRQCKHCLGCRDYYGSALDWASQIKQCKKNNWFKWENRLTRRDFIK